jgi:radical SAM enzyme (TIGR01210 family)
MYPDTKAARDRWVLAQRPAALLASRVTAAGHGPSWFSEAETDAAGRSRDCLTVLLRNPECPWRCVFCDLWQHTAPRGQASEPIADQIRRALAGTEGQGRDWAKLYNAGSFFDAGAIPSAELPGIAELCRPFARVIVECHPTLVRPPVLAFRDQIRPAQLEVALGLETAHPETLAKLNKGITPDDFARAAGLLRNGDVDVRAFVLVRPPFLEPAAGLDWVFRSLEFAFAAGASVVSLIIITIGASILLRGLATLVWDKKIHALKPFSGDTPIAFAGATLLPQSLWVLGVTLAIVLLLSWFLLRLILYFLLIIYFCFLFWFGLLFHEKNKKTI